MLPFLGVEAVVAVTKVLSGGVLVVVVFSGGVLVVVVLSGVELVLDGTVFVAIG